MSDFLISLGLAVNKGVLSVLPDLEYLQDQWQNLEGAGVNQVSQHIRDKLHG